MSIEANASNSGVGPEMVRIEQLWSVAAGHDQLLWLWSAAESAQHITVFLDFKMFIKDLGLVLC